MRYKDIKRLLSLQKCWDRSLNTSAVPPCLTLWASSHHVHKYIGFDNADLCVLPTQEFPCWSPLFSSPSEAHSHLFRIPARTSRRLSEMLRQELLTLLHWFTTVNCNTAQLWCQGDRHKFSKSAEYLGNEQKKTVVKLQNSARQAAFFSRKIWLLSLKLQSHKYNLHSDGESSPYIAISNQYQ